MIPDTWKYRITPLLRQQRPQKASLLMGLSVLITLMLTPSLDLVPDTYSEGEVIPQTILVKENITLVDARSTGARQAEAVKDFPPIYDYDTQFKARTMGRIATVFADMRARLEEHSRQSASWESRIRENGLRQLETLSQRESLREQLKTLQSQQKGLAADFQAVKKESGAAGNSSQLEKLRLDLAILRSQVASAQQAMERTADSLKRLREENSQLIQQSQESARVSAGGLRDLKGQVEGGLNISISESHFETLLENGFSEKMEASLSTLMEPVAGRMILASKNNFSPPNKVIQLQTLDSSRLTRFEKLEEIIGLEAAREEIKTQSRALLDQKESPRVAESLTALAVALLRPNLTENKGETARQKSQLLTNVSPVYFNLKKGDVVVRAGEKATLHQVEILKSLNAHERNNPRYGNIFGTWLITIVTLALFYQLINQFSRSRYTTLSRLMLLSLLILLPLLLAHIQLLIVPALTTVYDTIATQTYNLLVPVALTSMLAGILLSFEVAVFLGFVSSLFMALLLDGSLDYFLFAFLGSLVASLPMRHFDTRYALWWQGLRVSAMGMTAILISSLLNANPVDFNLALNLGAGLANGLAVAFFTTTLLPFLESGFDITTNMRLLELSNMNQPALKELSVRAPGTYHHSIVVGNLAESAADGIQGNALLVRVAAYYHDLGKMLCPMYFVENQASKNYHDDLPAKTSARIIISHVKNGMEIAKRYRLGRSISDILVQHHGTSLVRYFFHKAQKESEERGGDVLELDYRYPGPKPQDKNAGLVMLADVTESATRSLSEPSQDAIREMVQKQTTRIYSEGQLDESGMTFNDLNYIEKTFTKMLLSIHHHRIAYPEMRVVERGRMAGTTDSAPPSKEGGD